MSINTMNEKFLKPYSPQNTEKKIYDLWEKSGYFNPENLPEKNIEPFTIMMPPPNVTGILHMGHALGLTIQDTIIRFQRMNGKKALWLPGTDHAAIATQSKVEGIIKKETGLNRRDIGREEMLKRINQFAKESHDTIISQIKIMGASCDWSREAFTLDEKRNNAVNVVFKKMHEDGLIYRGYRIVNWDPKGQTTISDDEIVYEERDAKLYTFKYSKDFPILISTTRPETKVGDVAVAVHPKDERYQKYVGKEYKDIDFCGVKINIKIIADESVEKDFGTGALGVTPAHSTIDWDIAQKNDLPIIPVINEYAKMSVGDERLLNKKAVEAREVVTEWLRAEGLLEKEEDIKQNISKAERTDGIIEPLPKLQWFVNVNKKIKDSGRTLKDLMIEPIEKEEIRILPDHYKKTYFHWTNNLRDWCISRQIWYGHRIPVYYMGDEIFVGDTPPSDAWTQDEDTLDTWFSSALWTFSTLGWPENTKDLKTFHPTNLIVPGYEILFFWIARMVLMSQYILNEIPFKTVYLTGMVRDSKGRKFSKSLNNGIDPIEIAEKFGADAGRMALVIGASPGADMKISEDKIKGYGKFANKIWNATRFVLEKTEGFDFNSFEVKKVTSEHGSFIKEWQEIFFEITKEIEDYKLHIAGEKIYHFFWHRFADEIIEKCKVNLDDSAKYTLLFLLREQIKALHPFMPFITEEIWSELPNKTKNLLIIENWSN